MFIKQSPRATGVRADQAGKASLAASSARATSADRERATRQISWPVAGECFAKVSPASACASRPSIQLGIV